MDNTSHADNNKCQICKKNNENNEFVSMVHKWREYGGYSANLYSRYFCSKECLNIFEKDFRCNHCHIVVYQDSEYIKGPDGLTYCNDEYQITVGDKPCYKYKFDN